MEAAVQGHAGVHDVLVVGVPDERFGQKVAAVISAPDGVQPPTLEELQAHCRQTLAGYKVPRVVVAVDAVKRTPAGKADYRWAGATANAALGT